MATEECSSAQAEALAAGKRVAELEASLRVSHFNVTISCLKVEVCHHSHRGGQLCDSLKCICQMTGLADAVRTGELAIDQPKEP